MIFGPVAAADAGGAVLAHSMVVGGVRWTKGRIITADDVATAVASGVGTLTVARLSRDDVAEDAAAAGLAHRLAGAGVVASAAAHGRANLLATGAGVLRVVPAAIAAVNAVDERLTVGTLAPFARVAAGEVVGTVKIIPFAVPGTSLAATLAAAMPLAVAVFAPRRFILIQSRLAGTGDKILARTDAVTRARIERLGSHLDVDWVECRHDIAAVAAALAGAPGDAIVLIAGASATADRHDVIPAAITAVGGRVERLGMPVDPGNLLCLGTLGGRPVIGLPGCARSPKRNGFDLVLERLAAGIAVTGADIAAMGVGGLLPEAERPQPRTPASVTGAIVLAAGRSTRMGGANKLLADRDGLPVVAATVDAVAAAGLPPPVVVVGHMAAAVAAALGDRAATIVTADDFADGMSRSLAAGLATAPAAWSAALIVLGDMPRVAPATLAALAAAVDRDAVVVPTHDGRRGNPIAWGRNHWPRLAALTGDRGARDLLAAVDVTAIEVDDPGIFADVDTPAALAALRED